MSPVNICDVMLRNTKQICEKQNEFVSRLTFWTHMCLNWRIGRINPFVPSKNTSKASTKNTITIGIGLTTCATRPRYATGLFHMLLLTNARSYLTNDQQLEPGPTTCACATRRRRFHTSRTSTAEAESSSATYKAWVTRGPTRRFTPATRRGMEKEIWDRYILL